jgi:acetyl-CoA C-acetyltransferase/acetyl-CoA acyltransferase
MEVYIHDAVRSPRGKARPDGGLAHLKPQELVTGLVDAIESRGHDARRVDLLALGCVGQAGDQGGHIALVSKLRAGVDDGASAITLNNYCVSGLTAVGHAAAQISSGQAERALAGGVEMMSRVPFLGDRAGYYTDTSFPKRTRFIPVVLAADRLAEAEGISREELDAVALTSQRNAAAAESQKRLTASRIPLGNLKADECPRPQTTAESLSAMPPSFVELGTQYAEALDGPVDHRHTIAHAPPICDGAGLVLVSGSQHGASRARARIVGYAESGGDPHASLLAGFAAMRRVLERTGLTLADMDRIEFMEAFGVTIAKFLRDYEPDPTKLNVAGGHIARGHPMGASGAILLSTLLDTLEAADGRLGLVVCSGASGVGAAMVVERLR